MQVFRLTLFILIVSSAVFAAEPRFNFGDTDPRTKQLILNYTRSQPDSFSLDSVRSILTDQGYLDNAVGHDNDGKFHIITGRRYRLGSLFTKGDLVDTIYVDAPFDRKNMDMITDSLLSLFQSNGNYFASAVPVEYSLDGDFINVQLAIQAGPTVTVSGIEMEGLQRTNRNFINRYLTFKPGDTLRAEDVKKSSLALGQLDHISMDKTPEVIPDPGYNSARVKYYFREKRQFQLEGALGYIPEDKGYFLWYINVHGGNIWGGGQKAKLAIDKREKDRSVFTVFYGQPVFWLGSGEASLAVHTRDFREQFYEFGLEFNYSNYLRHDVVVQSFWGWKNVEPASESERSFQVWETGVGFKYGRPEMTRGKTGLQVDWRIKYSGRRYKNLDDTQPLSRAVYNDTRNELTVTTFFPMYSFITDFFSLNVKDVESSEKPLPYSELFLLGGPGSLRGYRNDQFAARRLFVLTAELRTFLSRRDYIYAFLDGAYFERDKISPDTTITVDEQSRWGYGLGFSISSQSQKLKIELSWGENSALDEVRLNIGIDSVF